MGSIVPSQSYSGRWLHAVLFSCFTACRHPCVVGLPTVFWLPNTFDTCEVAQGKREKMPGCPNRLSLNPHGGVIKA